MKKSLILVVLLLVALVTYTLPAAAQSASNSAVAVSAVRPSLAIKAPQVAGVGEKVQLKVIALPGGAPVVKAGVWAVDVKNGSNLPTTTSSSELDEVGIFLGWTDTTGVVTYIFQDVSRYLLVACQDGYTPGFAWITIQPLKEMTLKGPETAYTGQTCEFTVYETNSGTPVVGAGVWAILMEDESAFTDVSEVLSVVTSKGIFLGYTNNLGQVFHAFDKSGRYFLAAIKSGYKSAFSKITIKEVKELAIRAPEKVTVLTPVPIKIVEKSILTVEIPVAGAEVWAISLDKAAKLDNIGDYSAFAKSNGIFLGWTNQTGYVTPKPRFSNPGQYWLVAIKDGYAPGISQISVVAPVKATAVPRTLAVKSTAISPVLVTNHYAS